MKYANSTGYRYMALSKAFAESKRKSKKTFTYQQLKKNGEWGKIRTKELRFYSTPEEEIEEWNRINPDKKVRLVEG